MAVDNINKALYTLVTGGANITSIIGTRFYPGKLPQNPTYPAATYILISGQDRFNVMGVDADIARKRFRITCWAEDDETLHSLAEVIRQRVQRFRGTIGTVEWLDSFIEFERQDWDDDLKIWQYTMDFRIIHRESEAQT